VKVLEDDCAQKPEVLTVARASLVLDLGVQWTDSRTRDCPGVFGELLIVFSCSVLSF
jgi:hypothetical protein